MDEYVSVSLLTNNLDRIKTPARATLCGIDTPPRKTARSVKLRRTCTGLQDITSRVVAVLKFVFMYNT
jgi:hypothetical protein